ncbi:hypothetical protein I5M27_06385 [Adhaeribacter sp. BT258]|uniref:KAP NTPase domain-containing protein n=1 Tax=Adhaeribacter terrigena TaxID=2793070 RepID=A0ABS1C216_9BACT|nr:P-loop NTPase fold protein [Adhaeribacter terrigena]MBK0402605.1 hypothetical protein [Adhaeribacter terrigena]
MKNKTEWELSWTKFQNWLFKKDTISILVFICAIIIFNKPIEGLLTKLVVNPLLSYCDSSITNDVIFGLLILGLVFYAISKRKKIVANNNLFTLVAVSTLYLYYRTNGLIWEFKPFSILPFIYYADILLFGTGIAFIFWIRIIFKNKQDSSSEGSFFDDEPLSPKKQDELGYNEFAKTIANKIEATNLEKSFAIGINAKWGMGKTSFFNLIKNNLNSEENIIIDFNSWNSSSPKAIVQDFFDTLQEELRNYYSSLSHELIKYSDKLVALSDNTITQSVKATAGILSSDNSVVTLHNEINIKLKKIDKRIIIFIDDLDRLDKFEIIEVMRLIRNTANFYNTVFLVAYDRDYALQAISEHNAHNFQSFLEKIFQLEINLPYFEPRIFKEKLLKNLKELLPNFLHEIAESTLFNQIPGNKDDINFFNWISSMRDVTRLSNSLAVTMQGLYGEVLFKDFLYLQLLRLKFPSVFEHISKNFYSYFITEHDYKYKHFYILKSFDNRHGNNNTYHYAIDEYLNNNSESYFLSKDSINNIMALLKYLFLKQNHYWPEKEEHLSVIYPLHFRKYFAYNLDENSISEIQFTKARAFSQQVFNDLIKSYCEAGKQLELRYRLIDIKDFNSREDFETVITGIFFFANQEAKSPFNSFSKYVGYDPDDLYDKLADYSFSISKKYYNSESSSEAYKTFLLNLFDQAPFPYSFESTILGKWIKRETLELPLSQREAERILIKLFDDYCNQTEKLDSYLWSFFHDCRTFEIVDEKRVEIIPEAAKSIFKDFIIKKDIDSFLVDLIHQDRRNEGKYTLDNFVEKIWKSWDDFIEIIESKKDKDCMYIPEFLEFYKEVKKVGFGNYTNFKFNIIPIKN